MPHININPQFLAGLRLHYSMWDVLIGFQIVLMGMLPSAKLWDTLANIYVAVPAMYWVVYDSLIACR